MQCLVSETNKTDKIKYLEEMAAEHNTILIALTETWLTDRLPDNFLKIPGFHLVSW